jgi:hypothetical protein
MSLTLLLAPNDRSGSFLPLSGSKTLRAWFAKQYTRCSEEEEELDEAAEVDEEEEGAGEDEGEEAVGPA